MGLCPFICCDSKNVPYLAATLCLLSAVLCLYQRHDEINTEWDAGTDLFRQNTGIVLIALCGCLCNAKNASTLKAFGVAYLIGAFQTVCHIVVRGIVNVEMGKWHLVSSSVLAVAFFWAAAGAPQPKRNAAASKVAKTWSTVFTLQGLALLFCAKCMYDVSFIVPPAAATQNGYLLFANVCGTMCLLFAGFLCTADTNAAFNKAATIVFLALLATVGNTLRVGICDVKILGVQAAIYAAGAVQFIMAKAK